MRCLIQEFELQQRAQAPGRCEKLSVSLVATLGFPGSARPRCVDVATEDSRGSSGRKGLSRFLPLAVPSADHEMKGIPWERREASSANLMLDFVWRALSTEFSVYVGPPNMELGDDSRKKTREKIGRFAGKGLSVVRGLCKEAVQKIWLNLKVVIGQVAEFLPTMVVLRLWLIQFWTFAPVT